MRRTQVRPRLTLLRCTVAGCLIFGLGACTKDAPPARSPANASAPASAPNSQSPAVAVETRVVPVASSRLPKAWREVFVVPYGPAVERLGTARGGEGGVLRIGPEYGAPAADGTWWFLDVAKQRLAHYDAAGRYLSAVRVPHRLLVHGRYFQWQLPHVLADGSLVAVRLTSGGAALLRLRDGRLDELPLSSMFTPVYDDGRLLYGSTSNESLTVLDPETGDMRPAADFLTPAGTPFSLDVDFDHGSVKIERGGRAQKLVFRTASRALAHVGARFRAGSDDSLHLFLTGTGADDEPTQLVGYLSLDPSGSVGRVEPFLNPFSPADPGSPAHLVIAPGSSTPMLVLVRPDGVHVYARR